MRIIKRKEILVLLFILLIALFFRTYQVIERLEWAHDADLYSWIVRDIVVQKHPRLIGQLTTAPGIFIGPAFYYMLTPFFLINNMQPYSGVIPITILGMFNVLSYYYVFNKLFDKKVGLIAAFLTAVLLTSVSFDRWVVPSTPTSLWIVWYFYSVVNLAQGNKRAWPILGFLTGLIWHIHIALAPTLIVIPVAIYLSKKVPKTKDVAVALIAFLIPSIPLILFEVRHGFQQTIGLVNNFTGDHGAGSGIEKLYKVVIMISRNINSLLFFPQGINNDISRVALVVFLLFLGILLAKKRLIDKKILIISYVWFFAVVAFFSLSSSPISEYYFKSLEIVVLTFISIGLAYIFSSSKVGKLLVLLLLSIILIKNLNHFVTQDFYQKGYLPKAALVDYIIEDAKKSGYPCVAISYITAPGENVGFRYLFWINNMHIIHPQEGAPIYSIVIPSELAESENEQFFERISVIPPETVLDFEYVAKICSGENTNLTDSMLGFVD